MQGRGRGRRKHPPRLYLRQRTGRDPTYVILDGAHEVGTGCGPSELSSAEKALEAYIASKYRPSTGPAPLAGILIADVVSIYLREWAPTVARPDFIRVTATPILDWWGDKTLAQIKGQTCRDYVKWRTQRVSEATAKHDLATLRAAVNFYHREHGPLPSVPAFTMPAEPEPNDRWLTRSEAARMLWATRKDPLKRHLGRFILIALYSGTRKQAILGFKWLPSTTSGWIDLDAGVMHRRGRNERKTKKLRPPSRVHRRLLTFLRYWAKADLALGISTVVHFQGEPIKSVKRTWASTRRAARLGKDVVPHTLRHTAATWLMHAKVDVFEAAGYLGMSVDTLQRVYAHHHPDYQRSAAQSSPKKIRERNG
jgi:integrase